MSVLTRCEDQLILQNRSRRTRDSYLRCTRQFIEWLDDTPIDDVDEERVRHYLVHLVVDRHFRPPNLKLHVAAMKYLFKDVLRRPQVVAAIPWPKVPVAVVHVLTKAEVRRLFAHAPNLRVKAMMMIAYAGGLRVGELVALQPLDIESERMILHIRRGKGAKLRMVMLSKSLLITLRQYWRAYRPVGPWLFPSPRDSQRHLSARETQRRFRQAAHAAGIRKPCSMHSLRHAFATHLMESGVDITTLQALLGHRRLGTTVRYVHLRTEFITQTRSPLDPPE